MPNKIPEEMLLYILRCEKNIPENIAKLDIQKLNTDDEYEKFLSDFFCNFECPTTFNLIRIPVRLTKDSSEYYELSDLVNLDRINKTWELVKNPGTSHLSYQLKDIQPISSQALQEYANNIVAVKYRIHDEESSASPAPYEPSAPPYEALEISSETPTEIKEPTEIKNDLKSEYREYTKGKCAGLAIEEDGMVKHYFKDDTDALMFVSWLQDQDVLLFLDINKCNTTKEKEQKKDYHLVRLTPDQYDAILGEDAYPKLVSKFFERQEEKKRNEKSRSIFSIFNSKSSSEPVKKEKEEEKKEKEEKKEELQKSSNFFSRIFGNNK